MNKINLSEAKKKGKGRSRMGWSISGETSVLIWQSVIFGSFLDLSFVWHAFSKSR